MSTLSIEELKQALTHYEARQADDGVWEIERFGAWKHEKTEEAPYVR